MNILTVDMETYYSRDFSLTKMTTEEYVRSPHFEVIGVAVKVGSEDTKWFSGTYAETKEFLQQFNWRESLAVAHNAMFDAAILTWHFGIKPRGWIDTLSMSRAIHGTEVSGSLAALAKHYQLGVKGTEVTNALGKRRLDFTLEELRKYGEYCVNDVDLTYDLLQCLIKDFPQMEMRLIDLTIKMYSEPVLVLDKTTLTEHLAAVQKKKEDLLAKVTVDKATLMSNPQFADVLTSLGVTPPMKISPTTGRETLALAKNDEEFKALAEHPNPDVQALVAARLGTKSTLEETRTERFISIAERGKMPVPLKYYAAHTGRWGGTDNLNLQNLPRSSPLKHAIRAPQGYVMIDSDSSQIEARTLAWLAGQWDLVQAFERGEDVYRIMASAIYNKPVEDITKDERFVGKTTVLGCFGADTQVLTNHGWKRIVNVSAMDMVWDGEEWVNHQGVIPKGVRETIKAYGIDATSEHEILTGHGWREWSEVVTNHILFQSALSRANLPSSIGTSILNKQAGPLVGTLSYGVLADGKVRSTDITSKLGVLLGVIPALGSHQQTLAKNIGGTKSYCLTYNIDKDYLTELRVLLRGVTQKLVKYTHTMAEEVLRFMNLGAQTGVLSCATLYPSQTGKILQETWIESITQKGTNQTIFGLQLNRKTQKTNDVYPNLKNKLQTYDIAYAGPRNRFTIATDAGPLIVHNCGYGMGAKKFQAQLKTFGVTIAEEEAQRIISVYRETYPRIPLLWKDCQKALVAILIGQRAGLPEDKPQIYAEGENGIRLPNGLYLKYPNLRIHVTPEGKEEFVYDTKKGKAVIPNRIYGGKVTENCIAGGTLVLTNNGWKPIEDISSKDKVHDGVDFVSHGGVVFKSVQTCIQIDGVWMTPDHEVLTNDGWKTASQNPQPYRPNLWGVNRYKPRTQQWQEKVLAISMSMWNALRKSWDRRTQRNKTRGYTQLWVFNKTTYSESKYYSWDEQTPGVCCMAFNGGPLLFTNPSSVGKLWGQGYFSMRGVATKLSSLLGRYGVNVPARFRFGSYRQQWRVYPSELPMDYAPHQFNEQTQYRTTDRCGGTEQKYRGINKHYLLPSSAQLASEQANFTAVAEKQVYDIINCGPRHRFVVLGNEAPFIVHNCCQALARIIIGEQMLLIAKRYRVVMTVHDAIACVAPKEEAEIAKGFVEQCMKMRPDWCEELPLNCEAGYGETYGSC